MLQAIAIHRIRSFGKAHVFYPEAQADRCTAAVLLEVDSVALLRGRGGPSGEGGQLLQYVNDRPYSANSFLSAGRWGACVRPRLGQEQGAAGAGGDADSPPFQTEIPELRSHGYGPLSLFER
jgi:hypothetical protein